ncbi:UNVERIFIED_CONTAM: hypothetical protein PYX00_001460 [Menopon gallinae]|uniref:Uncharacterized protein n=1 Tax=Menopon gallinae TaxID=328185 RepID=A0AAW2ICE4_9NEOP
MRRNKITPSCRDREESRSWDSCSKKAEENPSKLKKVGDYLKKCKAAAMQSIKTDRKARSHSVSRLVGSIGRRRMPRSRSADFSTNNVRLSQLDRPRGAFGNADFDLAKRGNRFSNSFQTIFERGELSRPGSGEDLHRGTLLSKSTQTVDGSGLELSVDVDHSLMKWDLTNIVEVLFQPLYENFRGSRSVLMRQARDLLLCTYAGNVSQFNEEFCIPAGRLIRRLKHHVKNVFE